MDKKTYSNLVVSSAPHLVTNMDTSKIMLMVLIGLAPSFLVSIYVFGARVIALTAVCIAASMFFEWAWNKLMHKPQTVGDLSAAVTGTLIAFNVPSGLPYWIAIVGCFVAIIVVKQLFGGLAHFCRTIRQKSRIFQGYSEKTAANAAVFYQAAWPAINSWWPLPGNRPGDDCTRGRPRAHSRRPPHDRSCGRTT